MYHLVFVRENMAAYMQFPFGLTYDTSYERLFILRSFIYSDGDTDNFVFDYITVMCDIQ